MNILEALKPFMSADGNIDTEKLSAAFDNYQSQKTIQPVQDTTDISLENYQKRGDIDVDLNRKQGDEIFRRQDRAAKVGGDRYERDTQSYLNAQMPILQMGADQAGLTRDQQKYIFDQMLADKKEAREFNARMTPSKVVDMVTRLGATAGLLFR